MLGASGHLVQRGQLQSVIECFPNGVVRQKLQEANFHLETMRIDEASRSLRECVTLLKQESSLLPTELGLVADLLCERLEPITRQQRTMIGLIEMAEHAMQVEDFLRVSIYLYEAVEIADRKGIQGDVAEDRKLKGVRNWLAHAGKLQGDARDSEVRELITSRNGLRQFFQKHIDRLREDHRSSIG